MSLDWKFDILKLLKGSPGLCLPKSQTRLPDGSIQTVDNLGVLAREDLRLERTRDRAQAQLDGFHKGFDSNVPLSTQHWRDIECQMSYGTKDKDDCRLELELDNFVSQLLQARRDWMLRHAWLWVVAPSDVLVARVHSCLMVLKKMHIRSPTRSTKNRRHELSLLPLSVLGDRWLAFDLTEPYIDVAVQVCEKAFPRDGSFD